MRRPIQGTSEQGISLNLNSAKSTSTTPAKLSSNSEKEWEVKVGFIKNDSKPHTAGFSFGAIFDGSRTNSSSSEIAIGKNVGREFADTEKTENTDETKDELEKYGITIDFVKAGKTSKDPSLKAQAAKVLKLNTIVKSIEAKLVFSLAQIREKEEAIATISQNIDTRKLSKEEGKEQIAQKESEITTISTHVGHLKSQRDDAEKKLADACDTFKSAVFAYIQLENLRKQAEEASGKSGGKGRTQIDSSQTEAKKRSRQLSDNIEAFNHDQARIAAKNTAEHKRQDQQQKAAQERKQKQSANTLAAKQLQKTQELMIQQLKIHQSALWKLGQPVKRITW